MLNSRFSQRGIVVTSEVYMSQKTERRYQLGMISRSAGLEMKDMYRIDPFLPSNISLTSSL